MVTKLMIFCVCLRADAPPQSTGFALFVRRRSCLKRVLTQCAKVRASLAERCGVLQHAL